MIINWFLDSGWLIILSGINLIVLTVTIGLLHPLNAKIRIVESKIDGIKDKLVTTQDRMTQVTGTVRRMTGKFKEEAEQIKREVLEADTIIKSVGNKAEQLIRDIEETE
jgi:uncharacterized coiled-coil protein SlyX